MTEKNLQVERALAELEKLRAQGRAGISVRRIPARPAEYLPFPLELAAEVRQIYCRRGIEQLYSHQAKALAEVLSGRDVVVATPTASGKTLIYNTAVLDSLVRDSSAKSLYLFPTKALSQDQLQELFTLNRELGDRFGLFTYDGDTPQSARQAIRRSGQVVITNPYMLHAGILPHHTKWASLFENLRYVVIDEMHYYTGVFGSHLANVIRRLRRICDFYGSKPLFILSSATIGNPAELAENLIGRSVSLVQENGAPQQEKYLVFCNPPVVNQQLGIRRSYIAMAREIAAILLGNHLQVIVFANSRLMTEILVKYLKNDFSRGLTEADSIRGYRGGYLPKKRREIEKGLREGDIRGVVATNALELGIDIGSLDAAVLASYPGSVSSTWQRIGRAGRRESRSLAVMVASSQPLDQFIINHPEYFSGQAPELGRVNPDNLAILVEHVKCAAFELPFQAGESFGEENLEEILGHLAEGGILYQRGDRWFWTAEGYPADTVSLTRITSDNFVVVDRTGPERVIAEVDFSSALETLHPKAVYLLEGEQYVVEEMDYENRKALVRSSNADYYTDAVTYTKIKTLSTFDSTPGPGGIMAQGEVHVFTQVVGFKKIKFFTNENVGHGNLQLPQHEMHTTAFWLTVRAALLENLDCGNEEKIQAVAGLAYLLRNIAPVILMCAPRDLGLALEDSLSGNPLPVNPGSRPHGKARPQLVLREFEPTVFLFDRFPGGIGFADALYEKAATLLELAIEVIQKCACPQGCPSCVGPAPAGFSKHKAVCLYLLQSLAGRLLQ